ncbi:VOC family protein [Streptomyces bohaiensis]|uniref:VOC family protein n=1 Tax=Streptomyces bohaiensis TaxID=1431344 RepID=A0ABX1C512_9ACTN|nr:VOC family protein [Streptomyces bohaiensis]NJQ14297.1 VOC family protein [Streptomyces bohaiensis]
MTAARFKALALEARDHQRLADWWCEALGYERCAPTPREHWPQGWPVLITDPRGEGPPIWITRTAGEEAPHRAVRLEVYGQVADLLALGAREVPDRRPPQAHGHLLADPAGNRFGVFAPPPEGPAVSLGVR